jgi:hypothetical protein
VPRLWRLKSSAYDKEAAVQVKATPAAGLLITIPGVGPFKAGEKRLRSRYSCDWCNQGAAR